MLGGQSAKRLWTDGYNAPAQRSAAEWHALLKQHLGHVGEGAIIRAPFYCDFGYNIRLETGAFLNFGCVILDGAEVTIGEGAQIGPAVQIYAGAEPGRPVIIGAKAWIGGGAVILPGVNVGEGAVVGAGSVVARSVAAGQTVIGNPAKPLRL
jgi:maltose O-acetyltransferase